MTTLSGILPAIVTPFDRDGKFNTRAFEQLLARLYAAGVHGVYLCGTTGEGMLQSIEQRKQVVEAAMKNSPPGKHVIAHVGANTTAEAIELARHAAHAGAHAISSLPPVIGNYSFAEIKEYYRELASAADAPVFVYFMPEIAPQIRTAEQLLELYEIPNVIGLKFTDYDLYTMLKLKKQGATVFYGRDEMLAAGLLLGADGGIGSFYNLIPEAFVRMWQLAKAQRWNETRALQEQIDDFISITLRYPFFPALKQMLAWTGIDCGLCLAPRRSLLTETEAAALRADLQRTDLYELLLTPTGLQQAASDGSGVMPHVA